MTAKSHPSMLYQDMATENPISYETASRTEQSSIQDTNLKTNPRPQGKKTYIRDPDLVR